MGELDTLLYACCPKCSKPIGRSKRCDGMELNCPKCGSPLRVVVDQDAKVILKDNSICRSFYARCGRSNPAAAGIFHFY